LRKRKYNDETSTETALLLVLLVFFLQISVGSLLQVLQLEIGAFLSQWILFLLPALYYWKHYDVEKDTFGRLRAFDLKVLPTILILVVSGLILVMFLATVQVEFLGNYGYEPIEYIPPPQTLQSLIGYFVVFGVSAGVCEEILFRGAVMPSMEREGLLPAIIYSSLLFALLHSSYLRLFGVFLLGIIISIVVIKTGSVVTGIIYHTLHNSILVTLQYLQGTRELAAGPQLGYVGILLFAVSIGGLILGLKILDIQTEQRILEDRMKYLPDNWFNWKFMMILLSFFILATIELAVGFGFLIS